MTPQEIAQKYGVPLIETSEKLDWKLDTIFIWIETSKGEKKIWQKQSFEYISNAASKYGEDILNIPKKLFPAPQMHEIAPLLPFKFETNPIGNQETGRFYHWFSSYSSIGYSNFPLGTYLEKIQLEQSIEKNHYAQAYAELYLALKEKNLLT